MPRPPHAHRSCPWPTVYLLTATLPLSQTGPHTPLQAAAAGAAQDDDDEDEDDDDEDYDEDGVGEAALRELLAQKEEQERQVAQMQEMMRQLEALRGEQAEQEQVASGRGSALAPAAPLATPLGRLPLFPLSAFWMLAHSVEASRTRMVP